jgi:Fungal protein kinase
MRYSLHITICGTIFNICLFDRAGGVVSKDYDLDDADDFKTFVRIIRRATCDMDAYELGLDPTVAPLDYLGSVARYPRFKVEVGENTYHTYGFPIWQSVTLQGRGTWVFGATKEDSPNPDPSECLVLKNAWRVSGRLPESTLYGIINKLKERDNMPTLRSVAEFMDGGERNDRRRYSTRYPYYFLRHQGRCRQSTNRDARFQPSGVCRGCRIEPP